MKAVYRAYCRSATQANCAPWVMALAVFLMLALVIGVDRFVAQHLPQIIAAARDAAAVVLCAIAAALLARTATAVAKARGSHYSYRLRTISKPVPAPGRFVIGEHADGTPATADVTPQPVRVTRPGQPAYSYTLHEPLEHVPGKSDLVTPVAADMAGMSADADALRDGDMDVLVSPRGSIFECNDADAEAEL
jgi:hypothetical protein